MHFESRFSLGQIVEHGGVLYTVDAVKFSLSKVTYDLLHSNGATLADVDSLDVNPVEGN